MTPKSGSAGSPVSPAEPASALEAATADPGEVEESSPGEPEEAHHPDEEETSWIEIEMVDEDGQPVVGERYRIELPNGRVARGTLDEQGFARVEGFEPGTCTVTFPELDQEAWERA